ncbi:FlgO family outer membrane protein [Tepidiphilus sp. J10]|uniref:FlgO family outer membrane protein n=1 Tax=Tepidiphilus sp. J10 TaxID=2502185 RepID=UPI00115F37EF|nr:FlgO family outer membrane protein [Tepidiphilus sp. J10]
MRHSLSILMFSGALALSACATETLPPLPKADPAVIINKAYETADTLIDQLPPDLRAGPVLFATFVDVDALDRSTTLGRTLTEQVANRFVQRGFVVTELKLRTAVFVKRDTGELMLAREVDQIARDHDARLVVVGTYAPAKEAVYLSVKAINPGTGQVLAAQDTIVPMDSNVKSLLR